MLPASVVRVFPFRIDDGTAPDLDDAVARTEASLSRSFNEVHMRWFSFDERSTSPNRTLKFFSLSFPN
jgi:hypothetical protein